MSIDRSIEAPVVRSEPQPEPGPSRRQFLASIAVLAGIGARSRRPAIVETVPAGSTAFRPIAPFRLADTRLGTGYTRIDAHTIRVDIPAGLVSGGTPTAAVLNVTVTNTTAAGFVTVYPTGTARPTASSLNVERAGQTLANLVTVSVGASRAVDVYAQSVTDLVIDLSGLYVAVTTPQSSGRLVAFAQPVRVLDTRTRGYGVSGGTAQRIDLATLVPASAVAVVATLTVTEVSGPGYWTGFAAGTTRPRTSSVNTDVAGQTRANQAILPMGIIGAGRGIDVFSLSGGHLVVDVAGYFTGTNDASSTQGLFVPADPFRCLDTREQVRYGRLYPGWVAEFGFAGMDRAQAVAVNLTVTEARGPGYFTGYAARTPMPVASNLNATESGQTIANHAILRTSTSGVAVYTQSGGHLIADVAGFFLGSPSAAVQPAPVNSPPPPPAALALPYQVAVASIGLSGRVVEGVGSSVVDLGLVGHWPDTALADVRPGHMMLFGHRTEHGGIFRNLHRIGAGDEVVVTGSDGRSLRYRYARRDVTAPDAASVFNAGFVAGAATLSLVACSRLDFTPTDVRYRIVVSFTLVE